MSRPRIYVTRRIPEAGLTRLRAGFDVVVNPDDRPLTTEELHRGVADADAVIGLLTDRIDAAFFDGTAIRSNILVNLGQGDPASIFPRSPRLGFDEACRIL